MPGPGPARAGEAVDIVDACTRQPAAVIRTERDVAYDTADTAQRLDIAWPTSGGPHPIVLLLHGGGWSGGGRGALHADMEELARQGYVAATASYRLTRGGENRFPAPVQDLRCAVRWLRANGERYGADPARIGVIGHSAGGHLASMLGTASDVPGLDAGCAAGSGSPAVQAVVSHAGPQDLRVRGSYTRRQARIVTGFLGVFPGDAPELARLASPVAHVSEGDAPFLLVHGTRDELVPVAHARRMRDALRAAGVPATLLELSGVGHGLPPLNAPDIPEVGCTTFAFLDRWLRPDAPTPGREP